jgi:hypothetical protein
MKTEDNFCDVTFLLTSLVADSNCLFQTFLSLPNIDGVQPKDSHVGQRENLIFRFLILIFWILYKIL